MDSADFSWLLTIISVIIGIITLSVSILTAYIGYLSHTLKGRLDRSINDKIEAMGNQFNLMYSSRLQIINMIADQFVDAVPSEIFDADNRNRVYLLTHINRLFSNVDGDVKKSLLAIEGLGEQGYPYYGYIERIKGVSKWNEECEQIFERLLVASCGN